MTFPLLMNEPIGRRIPEFGRDNSQGFSGNKTCLAKQTGLFRSRQRAGAPLWRDLRSPEDFVRHPVSDAGKAALQQKNGFDWRARVTSEKSVEEAAVERTRADVWSAIAPPRRRAASLIKSDPAEETRVTKNESAFGLMQYEMIVFLGKEARGLKAQGPSHSQMDADPIIAGEFEQHLFSPRLGLE